MKYSTKYILNQSIHKLCDGLTLMEPIWNSKFSNIKKEELEEYIKEFERAKDGLHSFINNLKNAK